MSYPFVNFAIGKALNKEWEDCGYSSKPSYIAAYGNVGSGISLSSDDISDRSTEHVYEFAYSGNLTTWALKVRFAIDGAQDGTITFIRMHREDYPNSAFTVRVEAGLLIVTHFTASNNQKHIHYHNLNDSASGRILTLHVSSTESSGTFYTTVDGREPDSITTGAYGTANQFVGVAPGKLKIGNLDGKFPNDRGNVTIFDFQFIPEYTGSFAGNYDVDTGIYTSPDLLSTGHQSEVIFDGTLVEAEPSAETHNILDSSAYTFTIAGTDGVVMTVPTASTGLTQMGKYTYYMDGRKYDWQFDRTRTNVVNVNYTVSGGKWKITAAQKAHVAVHLPNSPQGGIEVMDFTVPASTGSNPTITHNLGTRVTAGIFIDSSGMKHYFSQKTDDLRPISEKYYGGNFAKKEYNPFMLKGEYNTPSSLTFVNSNHLKDITPYLNISSMPNVDEIIPFSNSSGQKFVLIKPRLDVWDESALNDKGRINIYEITSTGMRWTGPNTALDEDFTETRTSISIVNDGTSNVAMVIYAKQKGWHSGAIGQTKIGIFNLGTGNAVRRATRTLDYDDWLNIPGAGVRQVLAARAIPVGNTYYSVVLHSSNPPGGTSNTGTSPDPTQPDQPEPNKNRPVDLKISVFRDMSYSGILMTNTSRIVTIDLNDGAKATLGESSLTELDVVQLVGSSYHYVNLYIPVEGNNDICERFLFTNIGQLEEHGSGGGVSVPDIQSRAGSVAGLRTTGGVNYLVESNLSDTNRSNAQGALRVYRVRFTGKNLNGATRVSRELVASIDTGGQQAHCDIFEFDGKIWLASTPHSVGADQSLEIFTFDPAKEIIEPVQTMSTYAFWQGHTVNGIWGFKRPKFISHNGRLYLGLCQASVNQTDGDKELGSVLMAYSPKLGIFCHNGLFTQMKHGIATGKGKLILFGEGGNLERVPDIPFRSSRQRYFGEVDELRMIPLGWREMPLVSTIATMLNNSGGMIMDAAVANKEFVVVDALTDIAQVAATTYNNETYMICHDRTNNRIRVGQYGMSNRDQKNVPFYYSESHVANQKATGTGEVDIPTLAMFNEDLNGYPVAFMSNYSGRNGTCAVAKIDPSTVSPQNWVELNTATQGKVIKAIPCRIRAVDDDTNLLAVAFDRTTDRWNAQVRFVLASGNVRTWGYGGLENKRSSKIRDFDICQTHHSSRDTIAAIVTEDGYLQLYSEIDMGAVSAQPKVTALPSGSAVGFGNLTKFVSCRCFSDGKNSYVFAFAAPSSFMDSKRGYCIVYRWNDTTRTFNTSNQNPYFHCVQLADKPFQMNGEWYWHAMGTSSPDADELSYMNTNAIEQPVMIMKWYPELEAFSSTHMFPDTQPFKIGWPRFPSRTSQFNAHPVVQAYSNDGGRLQVTATPINWNSNIFQGGTERRWLHNPYEGTRIDTFMGKRYHFDWVPENGRTFGNSAFGRGGEDFVLLVGEGESFVNPMKGFTVDPRWKQNEYPFNYNDNRHFYPKAQLSVGFVYQPNDLEAVQQNLLLQNGGTKFKLGTLLSWQNQATFVTPSVIPGLARKTKGKLYVECETHNSMHFSIPTYCAFYVEGPNSGQKIGVVRNSDRYWPTAGYRVADGGVATTTPRDIVVGLLFDYDNRVIDVYFNGGKANYMSMPRHDMRIRGMMRRENSSAQGELVINFGQVPFKHQPSGSQAVCGPTLAGTYPYNNLSERFTSTRTINNIATSTNITMTHIGSPTVAFIISSNGSYVLTEDTGWDTTLCLDRPGGAIKRSGDVVEDLGTTVRFNTNRWATTTTDASVVAISGEACRGVHVETIVGSGVPGKREFNMTLGKRASACLVLPHTSGKHPYWCFYSEGEDRHFFIRADKNTGYVPQGWEIQIPMEMKASKDGRWTLNDVGQTTAPNWNIAGEKTTFIFFAEIPGLLNVRVKDLTHNNHNEMLSLDTSPRMTFLATTGPDDANSGKWLAIAQNPLSHNTINASSSQAWSVGHTIAGGTGYVDVAHKSLARYSGGVITTAGANETSFYPGDDNMGSPALYYFAVVLGDGPYIYAPTPRN
ncbi:hypothetical protein CZP2022_274 [Vibrio phage C-ZP2022]|nr:hypothetical protein CZP2022_274 [Vibrio phage C-ZP2022]